MLKAEQGMRLVADIIPPEALRAARAASMNARGDGEDPIRAACLAMLRAWPGMSVEKTHIGIFGDVFSQDIILPLPQEGE